MTWKLEKWLSEVFPGEASLIGAYHQLSDRELAIVAAGVLDLALAELIANRLIDIPKEYEAFLGLDDSGDAPAGNFGARIQLALLLGIIRVEDARILRVFKNIRNRFAHRVKVDFLHPTVKPLIRNLYTLWFDRSEFILRSYPQSARDAQVRGLREIEKQIDVIPQAGEGLLLAVFAIYQAYLYRLNDMITRLQYVVGPKDS